MRPAATRYERMIAALVSAGFVVAAIDSRGAGFPSFMPDLVDCTLSYFEDWWPPEDEGDVPNCDVAVIGHGLAASGLHRLFYDAGGAETVLIDHPSFNFAAVVQIAPIDPGDAFSSDETENHHEIPGGGGDGTRPLLTIASATDNALVNGDAHATMRSWELLGAEEFYGLGSYREGGERSRVLGDEGGDLGL